MIKSINVMPDFGSSGIWNYETKFMIHFIDLNIPTDLQKDFEDWLKYYDESFEKDYVTFKSHRTNVLNKWGRKLAIQLKGFLPNLHVYYTGEDEDGIHEPELIKLRSIDEQTAND